MREDRTFSRDKFASAMKNMYDALGSNYTSFSEVFEALDDMRVDLKPSQSTMKSIALFKKQTENNGIEYNPAEFWTLQAKQCPTVVEAMRLYLEANAQQFTGVPVIKNRILFLANTGRWK